MRYPCKPRKRVTSYLYKFQKYIVILDDDGVYRAYESTYWHVPYFTSHIPKYMRVIFQTMSIKKAVHKARELNGQPIIKTNCV